MGCGGSKAVAQATPPQKEGKVQQHAGLPVAVPAQKLLDDSEDAIFVSRPVGPLRPLAPVLGGGDVAAGPGPAHGPLLSGPPGRQVIPARAKEPRPGSPHGEGDKRSLPTELDEEGEEDDSAGYVLQEDEHFVAEFYDVGRKLGEGTFGVVHEAFRWDEHPRKAYAVKYIEKAGQAYESIMSEIEVMLKLDHPNVVRCVEVIKEPAFTCVVMEKWDGCDVVSRVIAHTKAEEEISEESIAVLMRQMLQAVEYVHSKHVIHRDVKCDNYLCDRPNLMDRKIRLALADFGCACNLGPDERCTARVGTRVYKSPEMVLCNYGHKADVWACGVAMHVLLMGFLPYRGEAAVLLGRPPIPEGLTKPCEHLLKMLLHKNEAKRPRAKEALALPFIAVAARPDEVKKTIGRTSILELREKKAGPMDLVPEAPGQAVIERREVLMARANVKPAARVRPVLARDFESVVAKGAEDERVRFEWWTRETLRSKGGLADDDAVAHLDAVKQSVPRFLLDIVWTPEVVTNLLQQHNIDPANFGKDGAKTLEELADELKYGEAVVMLDGTKHNALVRVVTVVMLQIEVDMEQLVPTGRPPAASKDREFILVNLNAGKQKPELPTARPYLFESMQQAVERLVNSSLVVPGIEYDLKYDKAEEATSQADMRAYPLLPTVTRRYIVPGTLRVRDSKMLPKIGLSSKGPGGLFTLGLVPGWEWWSYDQCKKKKLPLCKLDDMTYDERRSSGASAPHKIKFSALVPAPPRQFSVETVEAMLRSYHFDVSGLGTGVANSLAQLAEELSQGQSTLCDSNGRVLRVCHVVVVRVEDRNTKRVLVEAEHRMADGRTKETNWLPGSKRSPHEELMDAVRRIVTQYLQLDFGAFRVMEELTSFLENEKTSPSYPGLPTLYRKHIVRCEVSAEASGDDAGLQEADMPRACNIGLRSDRPPVELPPLASQPSKSKNKESKKGPGPVKKKMSVSEKSVDEKAVFLDPSSSAALAAAKAAKATIRPPGAKVKADKLNMDRLNVEPKSPDA